MSQVHLSVVVAGDGGEQLPVNTMDDYHFTTGSVFLSPLSLLSLASSGKCRINKLCPYKHLQLKERPWSLPSTSNSTKFHKSISIYLSCIKELYCRACHDSVSSWLQNINCHFATSDWSHSQPPQSTVFSPVCLLAGPRASQPLCRYETLLFLQ